MHVDLDHDEVTWPPPPAAVTSPGAEGGGDMTKSDSLGFEKEGEGGEAGAGAGTPAGGGLGGAPPAWPEEAARRARRVVQSTLFPEFESFDGVRFTAV